MNLKYSPNKISKVNKEITLNSKITTLIWENWSWKSAILEKIFGNSFSDKENLIIAYSSWLNESFSKILTGFTDISKDLTISWISKWYKDNIINSFYFNKYWWWILIFLAYSLKNNKDNEWIKYLWKVKSFFNNDKNKYLIQKEPLLQFHIDIKKWYIDNLEKWYWKEKSLETSDFHIMLDNLLNNVQLWTLRKSERTWDKEMALKLTKNEYDFSKPKRFTSMVLKTENVKDIFSNNKNKILYFLWLLTNKNYFLDVNDIKLYFNNWEIELNDLSDWEFQLLVVYSLLDLFDSTDTTFLFDEVDSHLHYENINKLWEILASIEWKVITTTHIPDSIINNNIKQIKLVKEWLIDIDNTANSLINRLWNISDSYLYEKKLASKIENIVLIDDCTDWFIFLELSKIKKWLNYNNKIESIQPIKCNSWFNWNPNEIFWEKKIDRINDFILKNNSFFTKKIFSLCDKDECPIAKIDDNMKYKEYHTWTNQKTQQFWNWWNIYYLSWKRREIENYFLSYTLLSEYWLLNEVNIELWNSNKLQLNYPWDNDIVRNFQAKEIVQKIAQKELNWKYVWKDYNDLKEIISKIPADEISEDIEKVYDSIISKI